MIPFMDLKPQLHLLMPELLAKTEEILSSGSYIHGAFVAEFEKMFAAIHHANHCSGCSNGTSALFLALAACGIGPGDEVITVSNTFIATAEAISHTGATPVFVDINLETYTMEPELLENAVTERTKAIVPVHIYGCPADMYRITAIAAKYNLLIVEDCAQAHLAKFNGQAVGTFGAASSFSFYPGKNLGAFGDAGAIVSNDGELIATARKLLNHGRAEKYVHDIIGYNHRMDDLQAGFLQVKMKYLAGWTAQRQVNACLYNQLLKDHPFIETPVIPTNSEHVFHLYVVRVKNRDQVVSRLKEKGVETSIHYPLPLHLQPAYRKLGYRSGDFPVTETTAAQILSLPLYPELTEDAIREVCSLLEKATAS